MTTPSPYRKNPPPGQLPRWHYWDPAHWRSWQVIGVVLLALGALGRRAGCFWPRPPPEALQTSEGKPGWRVRAWGAIDLAATAGRLCTHGWERKDSEFRMFRDDEYVIQCNGATDEELAEIGQRWCPQGWRQVGIPTARVILCNDTPKEKP